MSGFSSKKILLTRSKSENIELERMLRNLDFQVDSLPLIETVQNFSQSSLEDLRSMMPEFDGFIFVSVNAVVYGVNLLQQNQSYLKKQSQIIAVGPRTAKELSTIFNSVLCPQDGVGAHSLLATQEMQDVKGKKFLILRGRDGNPWLGKELQNRQALVSYFDCYSRRRPRNLEKKLMDLFSERMFDVCFLHSAHGAINLVESSGHLGQKISSSAAVVGSQAIKEALVDYGWKGKIAVAQTPGNTDMIKCLIKSRILS